MGLAITEAPFRLLGQGGGVRWGVFGVCSWLKVSGKRPDLRPTLVLLWGQSVDSDC